MTVTYDPAHRNADVEMLAAGSGLTGVPLLRLAWEAGHRAGVVDAQAANTRTTTTTHNGG